MTGLTCSAALLAVVAVAGAAAAQTPKMEPMQEKAVSTYTGCIERASSGAFSLANAMAADDAKKMTSHPAMAKDMMSKDMMAKDAMAEHAMHSVALSSTSVNLAKYVGQKVTVTGAGAPMAEGMAAFTVKSLKRLARTCS